MNPILRDIAIGRRLAHRGLRVSRSTRVPYPYERLARYRAVSAAITADSACTVGQVKPLQQAPTHKTRKRAKGPK